LVTFVFAATAMSSTLGDICENIKLARENALLGNYETSSVYYQGALQQIQKLLQNIDPERRHKWQQVTYQCSV
jgi:katanin p60 ATPase-containing subunit A1